MNKPANSKTIGRFELSRVLGEGAQGRVYLARDAHLGREVAIKTLNLAPGDRVATSRRLIQEARTVSRLSHPNIVTLYDAGETDGATYLVFEYVPGETLATTLAREAPLPKERAVQIAIDILDGVACAHANGILHRDLKPGNIMFDAAGRARITDFGIAAPLSAGSAGGFVGTPLYSAPEYVARGEFVPQSDLYAVAAILYEMLTGKTAAEGRQVSEIMHHVQHGEPVPPSRHNNSVDERLEAQVRRGLAKRPEQRCASAVEMAAQLRDWLMPPPTVEVSAEAEQSTIEFLLRRMRVKSDFPSLSETIRAINRIAASDRESATALARVILNDFALTNRLLKLVNAATYGQYGKVSTISRAVVIVGFEVVRSLAVTLLFLDHMQNRAQAGSLKEDVVGSLFSGLLAKQLVGKEDLRDSEEVFICALYQNLGRMLATYYFFEESQEIERLVATSRLTEDQAANRVLGLSYERLGVEIARHWNFPEHIVQSMRRLPPGKVSATQIVSNRPSVIASLAAELRVISTSKPDAEGEQQLRQLVERYTACLPSLNTAQLVTSTRQAVEELQSEAETFNIDLKKSSLLRQVQTWVTFKRDESPADSAPVDAAVALGGNDLEKTLVDEDEASVSGRSLPGSKPPNAKSILSAGIQDITNTLVSDYQLNDVLNMIMETMFRGMGFARLLLAVRDARTGVFTGRFVLGDGGDEFLRRFSFPMAGTPDLFRLALSQGRDILISDARADKLHKQLPEWYRKHINASSFVLFPVMLGKNPVGLFYADVRKGSLQIDRNEANLLVTLRNQAVLAFKQSTIR